MFCMVQPPKSTAGRPVATRACVEASAQRGGAMRVAVAVPGLAVRKNPRVVGEPTGRVCDGMGMVLTDGNQAGCISVSWIDAGDRTTWTRASDGEFDVITID